MIQDKLEAVKNKDDEEIKSGEITGSGKRAPPSCSISPFRRTATKRGSSEEVGQRDGENTKVAYSSPLERMTTPPLAPELAVESLQVLVPVSESCENTSPCRLQVHAGLPATVSTTPYSIKEAGSYPAIFGTGKTFNQDSFLENSGDSFQPTNQTSQLQGVGFGMSSHMSPRSVPHMDSVDPLMVIDRKIIGSSDGPAPALPVLSTNFESSGFPRKPSHVFSPKSRNGRVIRQEQRQYNGNFRHLWSPSNNSGLSSPSNPPRQGAPTHSPYSGSRQFSREHYGTHGVQNRNHYHQGPVHQSHVASHGHSSAGSPYHGGFSNRGSTRGESSGSSGSFEYQRGRPSSSSGGSRAGRSPPPFRGSNPGHHGQGTPPGHHQQSFHSPASATGASSSARTAPEILKTLLRKKACLYEAGTSRAIALITWLVGRELAIRTGYFTRQELQYGVHQVVSVVIDSGGITRTKVNRCMQIILNSCFHYIIPRPDGVESGERFRRIFSESATDDSHLLQGLPSPWDNIDIEGALSGLVMPEDDHSHGEDSASSGGLASGTSGRTPPGRRGESVPSGTQEQDLQDQDSEEGVGQGLGGSSSKRVVLLCFNENVRSYEDVYRCHNEFIRDVANAGNLELTFDDWKHFFAGSGSATIGPSKRNSPSPSSSPQSKLGASQVLQQSIPEMSLDETMDERHGTMTRSELLTFRTSWCCKRYDHNPVLCGFAHVDVNDGWLRRNPQEHNYKDEMCPNIAASKGSRHVKPGTLVNTCPKGAACEFAHSREEIEYHPDRYKKIVCPSIAAAEAEVGRFQKHASKHCERKSVCPFLHSKRQGRAGSGSGRHEHSSRMDSSPSHHTPRHHRHRAPEGQSPSGFADKNNAIPQGSPMMYIGPAPESEFEKSLMFPGLRALFRRQCAVLNANSQSEGQEAFCKYELFGDGV